MAAWYMSNGELKLIEELNERINTLFMTKGKGQRSKREGQGSHTYRLILKEGNSRN